MAQEGLLIGRALLTNQRETRQPPRAGTSGWEGDYDLAGAVKAGRGARVRGGELAKQMLAQPQGQKRQRGLERL